MGEGGCVLEPGGWGSVAKWPMGRWVVPVGGWGSGPVAGGGGSGTLGPMGISLGRDGGDTAQKELQHARRCRRRSEARLRALANPDRMWALRMRFVEQAKRYFGVPYAKKYWKEGEPELQSKIFLDCCGLVRRVMKDLRREFGFKLGPWNQAYMYDTLPVTLDREQDMQPGDLVFISATYHNTKMKKQKHDITHVEIWLGDGPKTIGSRWHRGHVQVFDSYRFNATAYHSESYIFKSLDTWLMGQCRSHCSIHRWLTRAERFSPTKKSVFTKQQLAQPPKQQSSDSSHDSQQKSKVKVKSQSTSSLKSSSKNSKKKKKTCKSGKKHKKTKSADGKPATASPEGDGLPATDAVTKATGDEADAAVAAVNGGEEDTYNLSAQDGNRSEEEEDDEEEEDEQDEDVDEELDDEVDDEAEVVGEDNANLVAGDEDHYVDAISEEDDNLEDEEEDEEDGFESGEDKWKVHFQFGADENAAESDEDDINASDVDDADNFSLLSERTRANLTIKDSGNQLPPEGSTDHPTRVSSTTDHSPRVSSTKDNSPRMSAAEGRLNGSQVPIRQCSSSPQISACTASPLHGAKEGRRVVASDTDLNRAAVATPDEKPVATPGEPSCE